LKLATTASSLVLSSSLNMIILSHNSKLNNLCSWYSIIKQSYDPSV